VSHTLRTLASRALLLALAPLPAFAQGERPKSIPAARIVPMPARVVTLPSPSSPLVALRVVVRVGSQDDPEGKAGLAALTAAMVAQGGTRDLRYEEVLRRFYPMAAALSGDCRKEVTVFAGDVHRDNLAAYAQLLTEMIVTPRFDPADFERLRTEAIDFLTKVLRGGDDEELGKAALGLELYPPGHPYGHVEAGTVAGLNAITLDDVKAFHRARYTLGATELGVAGGASRDFVRAFPLGFLGLEGRTVPPPALPAPARPEGLEVVLVEKPSADATAISMGFPLGITRKDDDFYALALANSYLGEHRTFNGKLMQDLRGKRGLNYGDYSYIEDFIQDGFGTFPVPNNPRRQQAFTIWVRPVPHDKAAFALRAALWELDRLVKDGIAPADFEATRSFLLNYSKLWVQTLSRRLGYAMDGAFYGRSDLVTELAERLPKLTADDVNAAVRKHLAAPGMRVVVVTPDAKALAKALQSGEPTPIAYDTAGTPEDVLAEDRVIERFPLGGVRVRIVPVAELFEK
jgi:zinc protease